VLVELEEIILRWCKDLPASAPDVVLDEHMPRLEKIKVPVLCDVLLDALLSQCHTYASWLEDLDILLPEI